ncbi:hypothetical protein DPMN_054810 [Dreissena polymorpha]|uniref:Uncharacterized protein n=1 Tax=Dreissena polymorpha TaxID=45954 RepID=A0A9D4HTF4_DREPO|nr:hypothetical protein DPMN_054810 [Dreissena polymorpha]
MTRRNGRKISTEQRAENSMVREKKDSPSGRMEVKPASRTDERSWWANTRKDRHIGR